MTHQATGHQNFIGPQDEMSGALSVLGNPASRHAVAGFLRDATVITTRGSRHVQDLSPGDLVVTRSGGVVPISHVEQCSLVARAVYILAGSIGHHRLHRDTMLPAGQTLLVRDWRARALSGHAEVIACADALVDGEFVRDVGFVPMTLYRIHCQKPQILYADGMELGTADAAAGTFQSG